MYLIMTEKCWHTDPAQRPTATEVLHEIKQLEQLDFVNE